MDRSRAGWFESFLRGLYRVLLVAYPKRFRRVYGEHMMQVFGDQCREARRGGVVGLVRLGFRTALDVMVSAIRERSKALGPLVSESGGFKTEEHKRGFIFNVIQILGMSAVIFLLLPLSNRYFPNSGESGTDWLLVFPILLFWIFGLPLTQYLLMRRLSKVRPKLGIELVGSPIFSTHKSKGYRFKKRDFALICAVPFLTAWILFPLLAILAYLAVAQLKDPGILVLLVTLPMSVSVTFLWYPLLALLKPRGTLVEELEGGGVRFYEPVIRAEQ